MTMKIRKTKTCFRVSWAIFGCLGRLPETDGVESGFTK